MSKLLVIQMSIQLIHTYSSASFDKRENLYFSTNSALVDKYPLVDRTTMYTIVNYC